MKIYYSPCKANTDTSIEAVDENTLRIDGELFEFDEASLEWPDVAAATDGRIIEAKRSESGELLVKVRRFYRESCPWDTGEYKPAVFVQPEEAQP